MPTLKIFFQQYRPQAVMRRSGSSQRKLGHCTHRRAGEIASERGVIGSNARGAVTPRGAVLGDAGTVSLALSTHLPSPGGDPDQYEGDPDQYEEEQSGKHPLKDAVEGDDGGLGGSLPPGSS